MRHRRYRSQIGHFGYGGPRDLFGHARAIHAIWWRLLIGLFSQWPTVFWASSDISSRNSTSQRSGWVSSHAGREQGWPWFATSRKFRFFCSSSGLQHEIQICIWIHFVFYGSSILGLPTYSGKYKIRKIRESLLTFFLSSADLPDLSTIWRIFWQNFSKLKVQIS